jgi:hypothetical protein
MEEENVEASGDVMHHREITLADGRYMIFYTFGEPETEVDDQEKNV